MSTLNKTFFHKIRLKKFWFIYLILVLILNRVISDFVGNSQESNYVKGCQEQWQRAIAYQNDMIFTQNINVFIESGLSFTSFWTTLPINYYKDNACFNNLIDDLVQDATIAHVELQEAKIQSENRESSFPDLPYRIIHKEMKRIISNCDNMNILFLDFRINCQTIWDT
jgi:hypothetical protein